MAGEPDDPQLFQPDLPWSLDEGGALPGTRHRPITAEVDLDVIRGNARVLTAHAGDAQLMAVVKADGYGHGAVQVARAALQAGATWLGVALVEEGIALRTAGVHAPILVLSEPPHAAAEAVLAFNLIPTVYTHGWVRALVAASQAVFGQDKGHVNVHLKLDTGMRRVGLAREHWADAMAHLAASDRVTVGGIWSHLAVGDEPDSDFTRLQGRRFAEGLEMADAAGLRPTMRHLCNSGGTTLYPELHHDMVRCGIALYGMEAAPGVRLPGLRPALSLRGQLSLVKALHPGDTVSYGRRWTATEPTVAGTVPAGYADGVRRGLTGKGQVTVAGQRRPMIGTVCMDQLVVDLGPGSEVSAGEDVWLIGGPGEDPVTAEDWAAWLDTITYEVTCGLGKRIPRLYRNA